MVRTSTGRHSTSPLNPRARRLIGVAGSFLMVLGAIVTILILLDWAGALTLKFDLWQNNIPLWFGSGLLLFGAGVGFARIGSESEWEEKWQPSQPGRRFSRVLIYSKPDCELCEEAREILWKYTHLIPPFHEIDITGNTELEQAFGLAIPVIEIDGKMRFCARINEFLLRRLIEGTPPAPVDPGPVVQLTLPKSFTKE